MRPEPLWQQFKQRFGDCVPRGATIHLQSLTPEMLQDTLRHMNANGASGIDQWTIGELKQLPACILQRLCELYDQIEQLGRWPDNLTTGLVTPVPKEPGSLRPIDIRPITVMPTLYRLWGGGTYEKHAPAVAGNLDWGLCGLIQARTGVRGRVVGAGP